MTNSKIIIARKKIAAGQELRLDTEFGGTIIKIGPAEKDGVYDATIEYLPVTLESIKSTFERRRN